MMPSCDQTGVPGFVGLTHFHSSATSGSASLMSLRILLRVSRRQSPSSAIRFEMSPDAGWPWLAPDFFMFYSSQRFQIWDMAESRRLRLRLASRISRAAQRPDSSSHASTLRGVGLPTWGLNAELLCVLGVQTLPAELHRLGTNHAADGSSTEKMIQNIETNVPPGSTH